MSVHENEILWEQVYEEVNDMTIKDKINFCVEFDLYINFSAGAIHFESYLDDLIAAEIYASREILRNSIREVVNNGD